MHGRQLVYQKSSFDRGRIAAVGPTSIVTEYRSSARRRKYLLEGTSVSDSFLLLHLTVQLCNVRYRHAYVDEVVIVVTRKSSMHRLVEIVRDRKSDGEKFGA